MTFRNIITHDLRKPLKARAESRKYVGPYNWTPSEPGKGRCFYQSSRGLAMDGAGSSIDLRLELANDHLPRRNRADAYWADEDGSTTLTPIVARLPKGRGFLAGWTMGEGMLGALDPDRFDDPEDAARAAHDLAERDAERELERAREEELEEEPEWL